MYCSWEIRRTFKKHCGVIAGVALWSLAGAHASYAQNVGDLGGSPFRISNLTTNNSRFIEHNDVTSDDRGGLALTPNGIIYSGDSQSAVFPRDLSTATGLGLIYDGLVSDLKTETAYEFATGTAMPGQQGYDSANVDTLLEIGANGALTGDSITLSQPIDTTGSSRVGIFSGFGRIVVATSQGVFHIEMPTGQVTVLPAITLSDTVSTSESFNFARSGIFWGTAEYYSGELYLDYLIYGPNYPVRTVLRQRVSDGASETLATIGAAGEDSGLSDAASFIVSPSTRRWFVHYEGNGIFDNGNTNEVLAVADAVFSQIVTNLNDSGEGSLRQAILDANSGGGSQILFDLANTAPHVIALQSPLPALNESVAIDGTGQDIVLDGSALGANGTGLVLNGRNNIRGLTLRNFASKGVVVLAGASNKIDRVQFQNNGLGIDLNNDGPTPNDVLDEDEGPNGLQNSPTLTTAFTSGSNTLVRGTLQGVPFTSYRIQLFSTVPANSVKSGNGATYVQEVVVTTNNRGVASFSASLPQQAAGASITAITTDSSGNSSEISNAVVVDVGLISVATTTLSVNENAGSATVQVTRTDGTGGPTSVDYATSGISAAQPADYMGVSGTLNFAPGEATKTITVPIIADNIDETDETFALTLSNPINGSAIGDATTTVTIVDASPTPTLNVQNVSVNEGTTTQNAAEVAFVLSNPSSRPVTFNFSTTSGTARANSDYTPRSGSLTFAPGQTQLTQSIPIINDNVPENTETFAVAPSNVVNAAPGSVGTVTILDDDGTTTLAITSPQDGSTATELQPIRGTTLNAGPNATVTVTIRRADGLYFDGTNYTAEPVQLATSRSDQNWFLLPGLAPTGGELFDGRYQIEAKLADDGVTASTVATVTINRAAPQVSINTPQDGAVLTALEQFGPIRGSAPNAGPGAEITVSIQRFDGLYFDGAKFIATPTQLATSRAGDNWYLLPGLAPDARETTDGRYRIVATATEFGKSTRATATVTLDRVAPQIRITTPVDGSEVGTLSKIAGLAADRGSKVSQVALLLQRLSDKKFWNGREFQTEQFLIPTRFDGRNWVRDTNLPTPEDLQNGQYRIRATAFDSALNRTFVESTVTFNANAGKPPVSDQLSSVTAANGDVTLNFKTALNLDSAQIAANYRITINGEAVTPTGAQVLAGGTSVKLTLPADALTSGDVFQASYRVRAADGRTLQGASALQRAQ